MMVEEFIPYSIDMRPKDKPRWPLKVNKEMVDTYREWLMKLQVTPMTAPEYIKEQMEDNGVLEYLAKEYDEMPELYKFIAE